MKKRGFTLIELLAVIVILAIIALIATPIIMNVIENTKKGAAERSAENYIDSVKTAVAVERLKGNILEGEYLIDEDGNLCPSGVTCTEKNKIMVDMNGKKPNGVKVILENGRVTTNSVITVNGYEVKYNESGSLKAEKIENNSEGDSGNDTLRLSDVCRYQGTDESKKYDLGAEYECELGDGIPRTFYVLEDGDETTLSKTDGSVHYAGDKVGTAASGEISLIMSKDIAIGEYITTDDYKTAIGECPYPSADGSCTWVADSSLGPITANKYLKSATIEKGWKTEVYLPTYDQLYAVNGSTSLLGVTWLTDNSVASAGYLVSTSTGGSMTWMVLLDEGISIDSLVDNFYYVNDDRHGIRPVITVAKDN